MLRAVKMFYNLEARCCLRRQFTSNKSPLFILVGGVWATQMEDFLLCITFKVPIERQKSKRERTVKMLWI